MQPGGAAASLQLCCWHVGGGSGCAEGEHNSCISEQSSRGADSGAGHASKQRLRSLAQARPAEFDAQRYAVLRLSTQSGSSWLLPVVQAELIQQRLVVAAGAYCGAHGVWHLRTIPWDLVRLVEGFGGVTAARGEKPLCSLGRGAAFLIHTHAVSGDMVGGHVEVRSTQCSMCASCAAER